MRLKVKKRASKPHPFIVSLSFFPELRTKRVTMKGYHFHLVLRVQVFRERIIIQSKSP